MLDSYSHRTRFIGLVIGLIILFMTAYWRSISPSIELKNELAELNEEIILLERASTEIADLKNENRRLTGQIGDSGLSTAEVRSRIIAEISMSMELYPITLIDMPDYHLYSDNDYDIYSHQVVLEGGFHDLLNVLDHFEQNVDDLRVVSTSFRKVEDKRNRNEQLHMEILVQNVTKS